MIPRRFDIDRNREEPQVVAQQDQYRLVVRFRNKQSWPGICDLTLERRSTDAMNREQWSHTGSVMIHYADLRENKDQYAVNMLALLLLPVERS